VSDITDKELAEIEDRARRVERDDDKTPKDYSTTWLAGSDVPRLIAALRASRAEVERLREDVKEAWARGRSYSPVSDDAMGGDL
jgi:hypothetical protein